MRQEAKEDLHRWQQKVDRNPRSQAAVTWGTMGLRGDVREDARCILSSADQIWRGMWQG